MIADNLLKGDKVRLTAIRKEDIQTIAGWYENANFLRYFDTVPAVPKTEEQLNRWITDQQQSFKSYVFAIRPIGGSEMVGYIELDGILWNQGVSGLGVGIGDEKSRGLGYGKEAIKLLLDFAFKELNLYRIQLTVFSYNERAIATYESLGFKREGTYREFVNRDGKRYDMYLYGLLRPEWEHLQQR